jgi:hypothetical protein
MNVSQEHLHHLRSNTKENTHERYKSTRTTYTQQRILRDELAQLRGHIVSSAIVGTTVQHQPRHEHGKGVPINV